MSVNPSQSWVTPTTSLFGSGGDSNFPNGITIGTSNTTSLVMDDGIAWGADILTAEDAINVLPIGASVFYGYQPTPTPRTGNYGGDGILYQGFQGQGQGGRFLGVSDEALNNTNTTSAFSIYNISSISGTFNTTDNNPTYNPLNFTIRPDQASKGGQIYQSLQYDAVDTGANYALITGANNSNAFITSVWPGYISMPLKISGASVEIASDNETFLYGDGAAGALGTLSTGTPFLSGSNLFSSIRDATGVYNADMRALFSSLQTSFPACFS